MNDLISREEALKVVNAYDYRDFTVEQVKTITDGCAEEISRLPAVDAVPVRHGEWKSMGDCGVTECSICKWSIEEYVGDYNYCPNCGARMDEGVSGDGEAQD